MQTVPMQLSDVIYNAANQSFEALVTVHDWKGQRSYACAINAPIDMTFERAAEGLAKQAMRRHADGSADSTYTIGASAPLRAPRLTRLRKAAFHALTGRAPRAA